MGYSSIIPTNPWNRMHMHQKGKNVINGQIKEESLYLLSIGLLIGLDKEGCHYHINPIKNSDHIIAPRISWTKQWWVFFNFSQSFLQQKETSNLYWLQESKCINPIYLAAPSPKTLDTFDGLNTDFRERLKNQTIAGINAKTTHLLITPSFK